MTMGTDGTGEAGTRTLVLGGSAVAVLGFGWFALSHVVMGTTTGDALVEALGVMLGLLVVASVVGAVRTSRHRREEVGEDGRSG
jgi:hypothetical protein